MNEVLKAIGDRRSIRGYEEKQITQEQLDAILKAAVQSPSARNSQPWHFSVVQDAGLILDIDKAAQKAAGRDQSIFYSAPTVIFVSANSSGAYAKMDCGIATENICLAAHSLGLGSVILGMPRGAFESERAEEFKKALKFPEGYDFQIAISIGYPAATKDEHPVLEGKIVIIR